MGTKRYRLKIATWTVVREAGQPSPRKLDSPEAVVELARDLFRDQDDDREHLGDPAQRPEPLLARASGVDGNPVRDPRAPA